MATVGVLLHYNKSNPEPITYCTTVHIKESLPGMKY